MTRIDPVLLGGALALAEADVDRLIQDVLAQYLVVLSKEDRASKTRPRDGFIPAARILLHEAQAHPALVAAAGVDAVAAVENLDNVETLGTMISAASELLRRLQDSQLAWLDEAAGPIYKLYKMARVRAEDDGHLRQVVDPLAEVLANPPRKGVPASPPVKVEGA